MRARQKLTSYDGNFVRHIDWAEIPWQPVRHDFQVCPWRHFRKTLAALSSEWLKISPRQLGIRQPEGPNGVCRKRTNVFSLFWGGISNFSSPWYWNPWLLSFRLHQSPGPSASYWEWLHRLFLPTGCGLAGSSFWLGVASQALPPDWEYHCRHSSSLIFRLCSCSRLQSALVHEWDNCWIMGFLYLHNHMNQFFR